MIQWVGGTVLVLVLVLLAARFAQRWMTGRTQSDGPLEQCGRWRVAPDLHVRAVRVVDEVQLLAETRQGISLLATMDTAEFEQAFRADGNAAALPSLLPLLRGQGLAGS